ncbi:MAG: type II methionyl aminopeptidase [Thermoplasmatales archaeon]|nr:type II methionyl aminopeptidase [Thermoplasmatales archaeon]
MFSADELEKVRKAGRVAAEARDLGLSMVDVGVKYLDVANEVESLIKSKGCGLAFPCNISVNEIAAHYTPSPKDKLAFEPGDVVKIDCGAHVDGFVGDTAGTVEVSSNTYAPLIKAADDARSVAMEAIADGVLLRDVGRAIQMAIESAGFKPVKNLTGHQIKPYNLHAGLSVVNYDDGSNAAFEEGMLIACEPFVTNGAGVVKGGRPGNIYKMERERKLPDPSMTQFMEYVRDEFKGFPFCPRSCDWPDAERRTKYLLRHGVVSSYAILVEAKRGCVAQSEHTVVVGKDGCEITTLP